MGTVLRLHKEADSNIKDWIGGQTAHTVPM